MNDIRHIKIQDQERIETGAVQFNDDWPGLFIRGDNAYVLYVSIRYILDLLSEREIPQVFKFYCGVLETYASIIEKEICLK